MNDSYLLDLGEIQMETGIDPGEDLVPADEVSAVHHPYVRRRHWRSHSGGERAVVRVWGVECLLERR